MNNQLTQTEAEYLINMLKASLVEYITSPNKGKSVSFDVVGDTKKDLFAITIFRGKINEKKLSYNARIKSNGITLLELHLNATNRHRNPSGEIIVGSHWHIYKEGYENRYAFPAEDIESDDFVQNTVEFLNSFNIIKQPIINHQMEL